MDDGLNTNSKKGRRSEGGIDEDGPRLVEIKE